MRARTLFTLFLAVGLGSWLGVAAGSNASGHPIWPSVGEGEAPAFSDPIDAMNVELVGRFGDQTARSIIVEENRAYVGSQNRLTVYDLAEPGQPRLVGEIALEGLVTVCALDGHRLYLTLAQEQYGLPGKLAIVDVTEAENPTEVAVHAFRINPNAILLLGSLLYFKEPPNLTRMIDFSDPKNPKESVSSWDMPWGARVVDQSTRRLYVASSGLYIVDISNPVSPVQLAYHPMPGGSFSYSLAARGNYVFLGEPSGLRVFDVSDPKNLVSVGSLQPNIPISFIVLSEDYAYTIGSYEIDVTNIADPQRPFGVGQYRLAAGELTTGLAVSGQFAYVPAYEPGGFRIFRFDEPAWIRDIGPTDRKDRIAWESIARRCLDIPVLRPGYVPGVFDTAPTFDTSDKNQFILNYEAEGKTLGFVAGSFNVGLGAEWQEVSFRGSKAMLGHRELGDSREEWLILWWEPGGTGWYGTPENRVEAVTNYLIWMRGLPAEELIKVANSLENISVQQRPGNLPGTGGSPFPMPIMVSSGVLLTIFGILLRLRYSQQHDRGGH